MPSIYDRIYAKSPVWIQNIGISAYGLIWRHRRFGGNFSQHVSQFSKRESYRLEDWKHHQVEKLRHLLLYANENVPYYKNQFRHLGLKRQDLEHFSLSDLAGLPLLEKNTIRENPEQFLSTEPGKTYNTYYTSGTTGTPLAIKWTKETDRLNAAAYEARVRRWAGLNYHMSRAMIGGRLVVPRGNSRPPFWRYNLAERQLYMSAFHISPENVPHYVKALNHYRPDYLVGYASSHFFLARMIHEMDLDVYRPKAVLTSSEKLTSEMRAMIESVYHCPVFDAYNGVEGSCLLSECEHHLLHVSPDVGIVEILNDSGASTSSSEIGEVVTTGFLNFEQPLIRYKMGDLACYQEEPCACGREMPVMSELVGRLEDVVIGKDGREMVRFHGIFVGLPFVREGQVIQHDFTRFEIKLVVDVGFGEKEIEIIQKRFEERLGQVQLNFVFVNHIERTQNGKYKAVISHVKRAQTQS